MVVVLNSRSSVAAAPPCATVHQDARVPAGCRLRLGSGESGARFPGSSGAEHAGGTHAAVTSFCLRLDSWRCSQALAGELDRPCTSTDKAIANVV